MIAPVGIGTLIFQKKYLYSAHALAFINDSIRVNCGVYERLDVDLRVSMVVSAAQVVGLHITSGRGRDRGENAIARAASTSQVCVPSAARAKELHAHSGRLYSFFYLRMRRRLHLHTN